ncbi:response regulator receiver protein [Cryobacterium melibiosiphilum]|uniref:Response regulator receiver protein n=1 Tax=Cryobacterium melibiosiphilum TaxID=995039 RepID=A0A3A5MJM1_9MICO|nr:BTAD domain-containing putative transcriptional regulator [Cryobacterium melibiosiphilum]RJT87003.1 response regulator receiver protein [Cryobacterium melibiosiphilum]
MDTDEHPNRPHTDRLTVHLFGALRVGLPGGRLLTARQLGGPKQRHILEILLLQLGTAVSKDRLIELLWAGTAPPEARPTLESYVSILRRHLQPGLGRSGPLRTTNGGYVMDPELIDLDLARFEALVQRSAQLQHPAALPLLRQALDLAAHPLLADEILTGWTTDARARVDARVTDVRILAAETALLVSASEDAATWARQALGGDPLNERAWLALILACEQAGRPAEGVRAYELCRDALGRELGCSPGPGLRAAQLRLLRATAECDDEFAQVMGALLLLNERTMGSSDLSADSDDLSIARMSRGEAGAVVSAFLRRTLNASPQQPSTLSA